MSLIEVHIIKVSTAGNRLRWFTFADKIDFSKFSMFLQLYAFKNTYQIEMKLPLT